MYLDLIDDTGGHHHSLWLFTMPFCKMLFLNQNIRVTSTFCYQFKCHNKASFLLVISDYSCNFEDTFCGWNRSQTTYSFEWKRQNTDERSTRVTYFDHTLGSGKRLFFMNIIFLSEICWSLSFWYQYLCLRAK